MFWGKKKDKSVKNAPAKSSAKQAQSSSVPSKAASAEDLRAQAMANVRMAKDNLGEETIARIAAAMQAKQNSIAQQARAQIETYRADQIAQELKYLLDEDRY
jgi:hypothetical protein